jgi:sugar/nucleoside kinase (ribokinase family)
MPQLSREQVCGSTAAKLKAAAGSLSGVKALIGLDGFVEQQAAGHGPTMAMALASAGLSVTYIGNLGHPTVHPAFAELARRATVITCSAASDLSGSSSFSPAPG